MRKSLRSGRPGAEVQSQWAWLQDSALQVPGSPRPGWPWSGKLTGHPMVLKQLIIGEFRGIFGRLANPMNS